MGKVVDFDLELFRSVKDLQEAVYHMDLAIKNQEQTIQEINDCSFPLSTEESQSNPNIDLLKVRLALAKELRHKTQSLLRNASSFLR